MKIYKYIQLFKIYLFFYYSANTLGSHHGLDLDYLYGNALGKIILFFIFIDIKKYLFQIGLFFPFKEK